MQRQESTESVDESIGMNQSIDVQRVRDVVAANARVLVSISESNVRESRIDWKVGIPNK
jgi:hypothetical protein